MASSSCNAGLVLTKVVLVASMSVIEITSITLRSSLTGNCCFIIFCWSWLLNSALTLLWLPLFWLWFLGIDNFYVGSQAFICGVFITYATSLASASTSASSSASFFPGLVNILVALYKATVITYWLDYNHVLPVVVVELRKSNDESDVSLYTVDSTTLGCRCIQMYAAYVPRL